jgi:hypothetical protein
VDDLDGSGKMIVKADLMALMLDACPTFVPAWQAFLDEWDDALEGLPLYVALGDLARHLIGLFERGDLSEMPAVFQVVERWHVDGDAYVREAASVGLLEDLQNLNLHTENITPSQFRRLLGPESLQCWDEVAASWEEFFRRPVP